MNGGGNDNIERTEVAELKIVEPDCFGYYDNRDPSCRRCKLKSACKQRQEELRPECFGVEWSDEDVECQACIIASQCADAMEENEMARRKVRMRKRPGTKVAEKPKPEPKEEVVVEVAADADDYTEMSVAQLRAECEERELEPTGRKSVLVRRLLEDDGVAEPEAEPAPEPIKRRTTKKAAPKPEPEPVAENVDFSFDALLAVLDAGETLIVKVTEDGYQVTTADVSEVTIATAAVVAAPQTKGLRGDAFWREVLSEKYYEFNYNDAGGGKAWYDMTPEEKVDFADDLGVEWKEKGEERVDKMAMVRAIFEKLEIVKYKEEYKRKKDRDAIR